MVLTLNRGTEIRNPYIVHEVIGTGGYVSVCKASDKELKRDVALKRLLRTGLSFKPHDINALKEEPKNTRIQSARASFRFMTSSILKMSVHFSSSTAIPQIADFGIARVLGPRGESDA